MLAELKTLSVSLDELVRFRRNKSRSKVTCVKFNIEPLKSGVISVVESGKHGRSQRQTLLTVKASFITQIKANGSRESAVNTAAEHAG